MTYDTTIYYLLFTLLLLITVSSNRCSPSVGQLWREHPVIISVIDNLSVGFFFFVFFKIAYSFIIEFSNFNDLLVNSM